MADKLRIAQVAPLFESVPPKLYGGTERVVSYLTEGLVEAGHDVALFASGDSRTSARLVPAGDKALRLDPVERDPMAAHSLLLDRVQCSQDEFDLIHFHCEFAHFPLSRHLRTPFVTTFHGRLDQEQAMALSKRFLDAPAVSISLSQRAPLPWNNWLGNVYHGLPEKLYAPTFSAGKYLAFLGRISPEKGIEEAVKIAKTANVPLKVAAKVDPKDKRYFEERIRAMFDHPLIDFIGEIPDAQKQEFLGNALALLFPIDWPEPFGMVMIESMACGTPVIAYPKGAAPEVVDHGVSGLILESADSAARAVEKAAAMDRNKVRDMFERRFTSKTMAENYLAVYKKLALDEQAPGARPRKSSVELFL